MPFLPTAFQPPSAVEADGFRLRPITIHDAFKDYDAVMSNRERLWSRFGEMWGWPAPDLTLEQDIIDLAWHQKEAQLRSSFNYAVMSLDEERLLGCVYVDPPEMEQTEADIWFWARSEEAMAGFEAELETFVLDWLERYWPFKVVAVSGEVVNVGEQEWTPVTFENCERVTGPFYHGTKSTLKVGDELVPGYGSNFQDGRVSNNIYFTALVDTAAWGAEMATALAGTEERGHIYIVEPLGPFEDDPNVTNKRFPGNRTESYRTRDPLRVVGELLDWEGHSAEVIQGMLDHLANLREQGLDVIED